MDAMKDELEGRITALEAKVAQCPGGVRDEPDRMRVQMVALDPFIEATDASGRRPDSSTYRRYAACARDPPDDNLERQDVPRRAHAH